MLSGCNPQVALGLWPLRPDIGQTARFPSIAATVAGGNRYLPFPGGLQPPLKPPVAVQNVACLARRPGTAQRCHREHDSGLGRQRRGNGGGWLGGRQVASDSAPFASGLARIFSMTSGS
jgi:hypothetical protein